MHVFRNPVCQARVVGLQYADYFALRDQLADGVKLVLRADPANEHDPNAVQVLLGPDRVGFLERDCAKQVAEVMRNDAGRIATYGVVIFHDEHASMYNRLAVQVIEATTTPPAEH